MVKSIRALLEGIIDYAGLFPPAGLAMAPVVENYVAYGQTEAAWALGRFILPVTRLEEWESTVAVLASSNPSTIWRLSVLGSGDLQRDVAHVQIFNRQHHDEHRAIIDAIELKVTHPDEIIDYMALLPREIEAYFEIPISSTLEALISLLAKTGARAKVRTGGVTVTAFPAATDLLHFINSCHAAGVLFKATAGLHHPLRSTYRLTYEPESASAPMYGFLNLFLCAAFLQHGLSMQDAALILEESSSDVFHFDDTGVSWHSHHLTTNELRQTRQTLARSFGSCSFTEPINELKAMHLL